MFGLPAPYTWDKEARPLTWWGALGLALALYGVIVILEWVYGRIIHEPVNHSSPVSIVIRVINAESAVEHVLRTIVDDLRHRQWRTEVGQLILVDGGSTDNSATLLQKLAALHPQALLLHDESSADAVFRMCRHSVVLWLEISPETKSEDVVSNLRTLLEPSRPLARRLV